MGCCLGASQAPAKSPSHSCSATQLASKDVCDKAPKVVAVEVVTPVQSPAMQRTFSQMITSDVPKIVATTGPTSQTSLQVAMSQSKSGQRTAPDAAGSMTANDNALAVRVPELQSSLSTTRVGDFDYDGVDWFFDYLSSPEHFQVGDGFIAASFYD